MDQTLLVATGISVAASIVSLVAMVCTWLAPKNDTTTYIEATKAEGADD